VVGLGNGMMLGWLMWKSRLVPRAPSVLGLIGGPAVLLTGLMVVFGIIAPASQPQLLATAPEFFWKLGLGLWLLVMGFNEGTCRADGRAHSRLRHNGKEQGPGAIPGLGISGHEGSRQGPSFGPKIGLTLLPLV
jgi:hypothetical protein